MASVFVGDIHGQVEILGRMLLRLRTDHRHDRVVFLGDYVNRGPAPRAVIDALVSFASDRPGQTHFLAGNHDLAFRALLDGLEEDIDELLMMGGGTTIYSYVGRPTTPQIVEELRTAVPANHRVFLRSLEPYFEDEHVLAAHAGPDPDAPQARDEETLCMRGHPQLFDLSSPPVPGKTLVVGHYVQREVLLSPGLVAVDTGCGSRSDGRLSAVVLPDRQTFSEGPL